MDNELSDAWWGAPSEHGLKQFNFAEAVAVLACRTFTIKSVVFASA